MTKQQTAEWAGRLLTDNEDEFFDFLVPKERARQGDRILIGYAFIECPSAMLETPIPDAAQELIFGQTGLDITLADFSLQVALRLDGTAAIVAAGAKEFEGGRMEHVNADALALWNMYLTPYGFDKSKWMNKNEARDLKQSANYCIDAGE